MINSGDARKAGEAGGLDVQPRAEARVTTTVLLPAEALTIVAPQPEMLSQLNVELVLGIPSRVYLELLREPGCTVAVTNVGKLRLVDRNTFRSWLEARGKAKRAAAAASGTAPQDDEALSEEELARLGVKPAPRMAVARRR